MDDFSPDLVGTLCDPPMGWRFGFPKIFNPKPGMTFAIWLRQNGYPERHIELALKHSRFIGEPAKYVEHDGRGPG